MHLDNFVYFYESLTESFPESDTNIKQQCTPHFLSAGVQENTFLSNSSVISCDGDTTIKIVDLLVEQHTAICAETKHCNLTELQMNSIKRHCNKERTCTISKLIPNSCLFNDFERVSISYSCTGKYSYIILLRNRQ